MFGGEGLCKSGLCARTENRQEPGSDRGARWCVRCTIPGLCGPLHILFQIRLMPQMAVSESPGEGPQGHSQGRRVQGSDLPENEKEAALRKVWGAGAAHQCDMESALGVRFPERTKGRSTAGLRHQRGIPAHGLPENRRPSPPPTGGGKSGHQSLWRSCGPEAVPWAQIPPSWSCSWGAILLQFHAPSEE